MYSFLTSCVNASNGDDINEMASLAHDVEPNEFIQLANELGFKESMLEDLGYNKWSQNEDKTPEELFLNDWGINVCESRFQGIPTLYVRHSGIEHIYVPNRDMNKYLSTEEESEERRDLIDEISEEYEDLFYDGLKNENIENDIESFILKNKEKLIEFNIPLTSLAIEFSINMGNEKFISFLQNKEAEYLSPLITLKDEAVIDYLNDKKEDLSKKSSHKMKP